MCRSWFFRSSLDRNYKDIVQMLEYTPSSYDDLVFYSGIQRIIKTV